MANTTCDCPAPSCNTTTPELPEAVIKVFTVDFKAPDITELMGPRFEEYKNGQVKIDVSVVSGFDTLFSEIENDARLGLGLFDVFITPPTIMGSVAPYNGFADLTAYIQENYLEEWLDIFPGYREIIASYNGKILMTPFDGDLLHLFYNKEILDYYNFDSPRTWQEYNDIAEQVHGKIFPATNKTLMGSCIGRLPQCAGPYWAMQVLSSMTQTKGSSEGSLFDTKNMSPLTNDALVETLKIFEKQFKYGHPTELEGCIEINMPAMKDEECVLTLNWGNAFLSNLIPGKLGIDKAPGSQKVLDRETGKLVTCTKELCPNAVYYDDIGFVNYAPYAAFGGWSGAVNGNISDEKKKLAMEFLTFSASKEQSSKLVIPQVGSREADAGYDPYRLSHMNEEDYVKQGFDRETTDAYLGTIKEGLLSPNLVVDIRFPEATKMMSILDTAVINHLNETKGVTATDQMRRDIVKDATADMKKVISEYDSRAHMEKSEKILPQYQKLRGVYGELNEDKNLIGDVRWIGYALGFVIIAMALLFSGWVAINRKHRVVKISQPIFLHLICLGVLVLSSAIFPLGIDDTDSTEQGRNAACASIPWLVSLGFSLVFSALFSKLWRINRVFAAAASLKRVVVTEKDVLKPFAVLMTLNFVILLSWTLVDPMVYERVYTDELTSYGRCMPQGNEWKGFIATLAILNFIALIIVNVQAYHARSINDELSESKYIGLVTLSMFQIFIVGVPLLVIVYNDPSAYFFVWCGIIFIICTTILLLIFVPKIVRWKSKSTNQSATASKFSTNTKWSHGNNASHASAQSQQGDTPATNRAASSASEVESKYVKKQVTFADKESELIYREKLDEIIDLVMEEHKIDITSIILKIKRADEALPVTGEDDAHPESTVVESA